MFHNLIAPIRLLFISVLISAPVLLRGQQTSFLHDFAPTDSFVTSQERPAREGICLNGSWKFAPVQDAGKLTLQNITDPAIPANFTWETTPVKIPSPWNVNSFATDDKSGGDFVTFPSYPKKWENVKAGWLMRSIPYHATWKNKRVFLHFDAVGGYTCIYINKHKVGQNFDLFLPFEIDVTNYLKEGNDNELLVWVADAQLFNQPGKYGRRIHVAGSFWGQHVRGIWQDVNLVVKPAVYIQNTFIKPFVDHDELEVEATMVNLSSKTEQLNIGGDVAEWINLAGKNTIEAPQPLWKLGATALSLPSTIIAIKPGETKKLNIKVKVNGRLKLWQPGSPNLYGLVLTLNSKKQTVDKQFNRFGWRQFTLSKNDLLLNGKAIRLKGDSWHFMGVPQMTRRYAWAWFNLLKNSNANAVRLHAQPYPQFYMDMADEMGICVLDETGIWASDGGPKVDADEYWKNCGEHLKRLILRDRNHPSVFGWSVCNENIPVVKGVFHAPDSIVKKQADEINEWVSIAQGLDPSRNWISGDGETGVPTNLPTVIGHYGDENSYKEWSAKGKVWGIGESGMAYYATPLQSAVYNDSRSYESQQGRMEGVALEATKLLELQKKYKASYLSVFNLVWYGIKPLPLGLRDTTRAPLPTDGVFFGAYQEGKPGYQPERLGPYTTTLNPGYDTALPAYSSWPLLNAIAASFKSDAPVSMQQRPLQVKQTERTNKVQPAVVKILSAVNNGALYKILEQAGINPNGKLQNNAHDLLIIDGLNIPDDAHSVNLQRQVLKNGGKVLIWGAATETLTALNNYLPYPVQLTSRKATSFMVQNTDQLTGSLNNADFYFTEITDKPLLNTGLTGPFVQHGKILLEACNTDWKKWNKRAEYLKTAAVLRSEREYKPEGNTLVAVNADKGTIYLFTLDAGTLYKTSVNVFRQLFANLGVQFQHNSYTDDKALDADGSLAKALVLVPFNVSGKTNEQVAEADFLKGINEHDFYGGAQAHNLIWQNGATQNGQLDMGKLNAANQAGSAVGYVSFWLYSPRSLSNLLLEPDMPRLNMMVKTGNDYQFFLNRKLIRSGLNSTDNKQSTIKALPLEKGWNHFLIKSIHTKGEWKRGKI
jgi:hypothetical protein